MILNNNSIIKLSTIAVLIAAFFWLAFFVEDLFIYQLFTFITLIVSISTLNYRNYFLVIFVFMFSVFYVWPIIIINDMDWHSSGYFLSDLNLTEKQVREVILVINSYLLAVSFINNFRFNFDWVKLKGRDVFDLQRLNINFVLSLLSILSIFIFIFYIAKIQAIQSEGYAAYHLGTISVQKGMGFVMLELFFSVLVYYAIWRKSKIGIFYFILYNVLILMTGLRMPVILNMLIFWYVLRQDPIISKKKYLSSYLIGVIVLPPVLYLAQLWRVGAELTRYNMLDFISTSYNQIFYVLGASIDTVRSAILLPDTLSDYGISLFWKIETVARSLYNKITGAGQLDLEDKLDSGSFSTISTYNFDSARFYDGATSGSSFLAESYLSLGFLGIIIAALFHVYLSQFLHSLKYKESFFHFLLVVLIAHSFLNSIRNDSIGWLFIVAIYYVVYILIIYFVRLIGKGVGK
jgi:hypothetical protein